MVNGFVVVLVLIRMLWFVFMVRLVCRVLVVCCGLIEIIMILFVLLVFFSCSVFFMEILLNGFIDILMLVRLMFELFVFMWIFML